MKHFIFACVVFLFAFQPLAQAIDIKFIPEETAEDLRSISIEPTASLDGSIISLSAPVTLRNVRVVVKDITGNVVYSETTIIPAKQYHSFVLDNVEDGDYILEVTFGDKYFYGYFTLQ